MNRSEFLAQLKSALENDLSAGAVKENVDYYNEYIQGEVRNGKSEQEVIDMLGDPWAIAKTVLMSAEINGQEYSSGASDVQEKEILPGKAPESTYSDWTHGGKRRLSS